MLTKEEFSRTIHAFKTSCLRQFLLLGAVFCFSLFTPSLYGDEQMRNNLSEAYEASGDKESLAEKGIHPPLVYYLYIDAFAQSFIEIPTSNVSGSSTTLSSTYLAGRAPIYDQDNRKVGTCSASFLCMQTADGIYTDISNYLSADSGLIISWLTPTTLINLELDSIINSMVTECLVTATTKVGVNPFYGQTFSLVVSSENGRIYFKFTRTGTIF